MCCILGAFSSSGPFERLPLSTRELDLMRHRGPDGQGWFISPQAQMGFRRLAIIDQAGGAQPLYNEDESIVLTFNGEIYNYRRLRQKLAAGHRFRTASDAEVVLHLYEEHGLQFVEHLEGMFALALYDRHRNRLLLLRDRAGQKPLYYRWRDDMLYWSSELRPICEIAGAEKPKIDAVALADYLRFGYIPAPRTMLEGVCKLSAAHMLVADDTGRTRQQRYWKLRYSSDGSSEIKPMELNHWGDLLRGELDRTVQCRLESEAPMAFLLSGGIDSCSVFASGAAALARGEAKAFTITFPGEKIDESTAASAVAQRYAARHELTPFSRSEPRSLLDVLASVEEPISTDALLPTDRIFEAVRSAGMTVMLAGEGSDELFAGYRKFAAAMRPDARSGRASPLERYLQHEEFVFRSPAERRAIMVDEVAERDYSELEAEVAELDPLGQMLAIENQMRLPDRINLRLDKLSMAHSIEARAPFMDHLFRQFTTGIPRTLLRGNGQDKLILRHAMRMRLPTCVLEAKKAPFHAPHSWEVEQIPPGSPLHEETVRSAGMIRPEALRQLRQAANGYPATGEKLFSLYVLHAWYQGFYQRLCA